MSFDSPFANHAFAVQNGISFPLLSDMNREAIRAYGLAKESTVGGVKIESARRATFLIDKEGRVLEQQVDREALDPTRIVEACQLKRSSK